MHICSYVMYWFVWRLRATRTTRAEASSRLSMSVRALKLQPRKSRAAKKPLNVFLVLWFLCIIWFQRVISSIVWRSLVPAMPAKPHTLYSPSRTTYPVRATTLLEDRFISGLVPNQWHLSSQMKSRTPLCLLKPLRDLCSQMYYITQLWSETAATGDI